MRQRRFISLATEQDIETWLTAPAEDALKLQRPIDGLKIVARRVKEDDPAS